MPLALPRVRMGWLRRPAPAKSALCVCTLLSVLAACDLQEPEKLAAPTTRTVALKMSPEDRQKVQGICDRILVHAVNGDSSKRLENAIVFSDTLSTVPIELPDEERSGTWRIVAEFVDASGGVRYEAAASIAWQANSPRELSVSAIVVATCHSGCAADTTPIRPRPPAVDTVVFQALRDVSIDREGWNLGKEANLRLFYDDAVALIDFGSLDTLVAGRRVVSARLIVQGFVYPAAESSSLVVGTAARGWIEGTGNWYWWGGTGHNGFATAYANYPGFVPEDGTEDPATASGIRWSASADLRAGLEAVSDTSVGLPTPPRAGAYPLVSQTVRIAFDVTGAVQAMGETGARSFALTQAGAQTGAQTVAIFFFSRENPAGGRFGPQLEIVLAR